MSVGGFSRGERRTVRSIVVAVVALAAVLFAASPALAVPRVVVSPSNGFAGAALKATASGFPVAQVEFFWDGTVSIGTQAADTNGRAILTFAIPTGATPGAHFVRACSPGCAVTADGKVTVVAPTPPPPTPAPTPKPTPVRTPVPTPHPTPQPTVRPPGSTAATTPTPGSTDLQPSAAPSLNPVASQSASPAPTDAGTAAPGPTSGALETDAPLPAGPTSDTGPFAGGLVIPIVVVGALIVVGIAVSVRRRGSRAPSPALAGYAAPSEPSPTTAELLAAMAPVVAPSAGLEPVGPVEPAWPAEPNWPSIEPTPAIDPTGPAEPDMPQAPPSPPEPSSPIEPPPPAEPAAAAAVDPWTGVRTIRVHVEPRENDEP